MTFSSSKELLQFMKIGWNLGNTLDAPMGETSWHNPITTKQMIDKIKEGGFNTLRVPVSWHCHVSEAPEFIIQPGFLDRVEEVINYGLDNGMAVIVNIHHDDRVVSPTDEGSENSKNYIKAIWSQLCDRFGDYDERLIFENLNEPRMIRCPQEWHLDMRTELSQKAVAHLNDFNQLFVDTVRASGKKNSQRYIMVSSYAANPMYACMPEYRFPCDPSNRTVQSVHSYSPYNLCLNNKSDIAKFTEKDRIEVRRIMERLNNRFVSNGIDVVIGEIGILNKDNPEARFAWSEYFISQARKNGIVCVWWDNHHDRSFGILNRHTCQFHESAKCVLDGLLKGLED